MICGQKTHILGISWSVICGQKIHKKIKKFVWESRGASFVDKKNHTYFLRKIWKSCFVSKLILMSPRYSRAFIFLFVMWYIPMITSRDSIKWCTDGLTILVSNSNETKKKLPCMTSSVRKEWMWIFCPQMTLQNVPDRG